VLGYQSLCCLLFGGSRHSTQGQLETPLNLFIQFLITHIPLYPAGTMICHSQDEGIIQ